MQSGCCVSCCRGQAAPSPSGSTMTPPCDLQHGIATCRSCRLYEQECRDGAPVDGVPAEAGAAAHCRYGLLQIQVCTFWRALFERHRLTEVKQVRSRVL